MSRKAARERRDQTRGGDHDAKGAETTRRCISTGLTLEKEALIRFVAGPDGEIVPDLGNDLPGRGAWVKAERAAIDRAIGKGLFAKPLETGVKPPDSFSHTVEALLVKRTLNLLGLAKKSGLIIAGYERVKETMDKSEAGLARIAALLEASDGSDDGRRSILAKAKAMELSATICGLFSSEELCMALGGANVIHACLLSAGAGTLHARFLQEAGRTAGFRAMTPAAWAGQVTEY